MNPAALPPGAWLGVLGGGEDACMLTLAAQRMGYRIAVLDPDERSPAAAVADRWVRGDVRDEAALAGLAASCAGAFAMAGDWPPALARFADVCPLVPRPAVAAQCADPARWSALVEGCGIDLAQPAEDAPQRREIAVIVARRGTGDLSCYPAVEVLRTRGVLETSIAPARISRALAARAAAAAERIVERLDCAGVLCVELALLHREALALRALVPRPHGCGYHTIDACPTSQFEQQVRILVGMPLGPTEQRSTAVVVPVAAELWDRPEREWRRLLERRGGVLHPYGWSEARPGRSMGHFTICATHIETAIEAAHAVRAELTH